MPIRADLKPLYPENWLELSHRVRFKIAAGRCQTCRRPHLETVLCLPDGRWFDAQAGHWRDHRGRRAKPLDLFDSITKKFTRVVLACAHLDNDPTNNRLSNLKALCTRCHLLHDLNYHLAQRWLTYHRRYAIGDHFFGLYGRNCPPEIVQALLSRPPTLVFTIRQINIGYQPRLIED